MDYNNTITDICIENLININNLTLGASTRITDIGMKKLTNITI